MILPAKADALVALSLQPVKFDNRSPIRYPASGRTAGAPPANCREIAEKKGKN
jgi:hypothetical protein